MPEVLINHFRFFFPLFQPFQFFQLSSATLTQHVCILSAWFFEILELMTYSKAFRLSCISQVATLVGQASSPSLVKIYQIIAHVASQNPPVSGSTLRKWVESQASSTDEARSRDERNRKSCCREPWKWLIIDSKGQPNGSFQSLNN
jgi:hypothetical protein